MIKQKNTIRHMKPINHTQIIQHMQMNKMMIKTQTTHVMQMVVIQSAGTNSATNAIGKASSKDS